MSKETYVLELRHHNACTLRRPIKKEITNTDPVPVNGRVVLVVNGDPTQKADPSLPDGARGRNNRWTPNGPEMGPLAWVRVDPAAHPNRAGKALRLLAKRFYCEWHTRQRQEKEARRKAWEDKQRKWSKRKARLEAKRLREPSLA